MSLAIVLVEDYIEAWRNRDIRRLGDFLSDEFVSIDTTRNLETTKSSFLKRKVELSEKYSWIKIDIEDIRATTENDIVNITYKQTFQGCRNREKISNGQHKGKNRSYWSTGQNQFSIEFSNGTAKIVKETFDVDYRDLKPCDPLDVQKNLFGKLRLCEEDDFDIADYQCDVSKVEFYKPIQKIYGSWTYTNMQHGTIITRRYFFNGEEVWVTRNTVGGEDEHDRWIDIENNKAFWILIDARSQSARQAFGSEHLPSGAYRIEMFINNKKDQELEFSII